MALNASPFPRMVTSSVTVFQWLYNSWCQHLASSYSLLLDDFVEASARKSTAARNIPQTSANHLKYISVGKMLPVQAGGRCCLSQEHLVMWECLKPASSCQHNLFLSTGAWRTNHQTADADQTLTSTDGHVGTDRTLANVWQAALECRFSFLFWYSRR